MGLLARLTRRNLSYQQVWMSDSGESSDGPRATEKSASGLIAFMSAVRLLTDDISTLPMGAFVKIGGQAMPYFPRPLWIDNPVPANPNITRAVQVSEIMSSLLFDGNAMLYCLPSVVDPAEITVLTPSEWTVGKRPNGAPTYSNGRVTLGSDQVVHVPLVKVPGAARGLSFIESARQAIIAGVAVEQFAGRFFTKGASPSVVLKLPPGVKLTEAQARELADRFASNNAGVGKSHGVAVLDQGGDIVPWSITPEQAQFIETRLANTEDMARLFRIPPPMLGINAPGAVSYASVEQQSINYVVHTLRPYLERIEQAFSRLLPARPDGTQPYVKFNVAGLLRGDLKSRYEAYSSGLMSGFITYNDVRRLEDLPPMEGGDTQRVPLTHTDPALGDLAQRTSMAAALVGKGFDPEDTMAKLGLPAIKHTGVPVTVYPEGGTK
jgi:HK97 family phage portal protein